MMKGKEGEEEEEEEEEPSSNLFTCDRDNLFT